MVAVAGLSVSPTATVIDVRDMKKGRLLGTVNLRRVPIAGLAAGEADVAQWVADARTAIDRAGATELAAISVAAPLHALVVLDASASPVRPALLAEDQRSGPDAGWCTKKIPALDWSTSVGSVPSAALTVTKLSWLHRSEPDAWSRIARLCSIGGAVAAALCETLANYVTDRVTASGTGYWSATRNAYDSRVLTLIDAERAWDGALPEVAGALDTVGTRGEAKVGVGTADLMAMAVALGAETGDVIVSIAERVIVYGLSDRAVVDETGTISSFASLSGGFLPAVALPIDADEVSAGVIAAIRTMRNAGVPTGGRLFVCGPEHSVIDIALRCSRSEGSRVQVCTDDELAAIGASRQAAAMLLGEWPSWQPVVTRRV